MVLSVQLLRRDLREIFYGLYEGTKPVYVRDKNGDIIYDEYGNPLETGEPQITYSDPILLYSSVSPARGDVSARQFGELVDYDRTVAFVGEPPMTEQAVLWVDCVTSGEVPQENGDYVPYDYTISKIAYDYKDNSTVLAISKVDVSNG